MTPDDTEILARFQVDYTRLRTEGRPEGGVLTPLRVYHHIGDISFIRQEFIDRVDVKFRVKQARLDQLQTSILDRIRKIIRACWNWVKAGWALRRS